MFVSVIIATRNRADAVVRLVASLDEQTLDAQRYEVIVVDDGSPDPVGPRLDTLHVRATLRHVRIAWSGQAAARHEGALLARGDVLVFVDDDMQLSRGFLAAHLARHEQQPLAVVLGRIQPDPGLEHMPVFERYHARQLERWRQGVLAGRVAVRGVHLCTGNVSMRRNDYLVVGGFDRTLQRSEDRELGIRLERAGCTLLYADEAAAVHASDHADPQVWLRRAHLYGRFDRRIAAMHPEVDNAHPWRFWSLIKPSSRPIVGLSLVWPLAGRLLSRVVYGTAAGADRLRLGALAVHMAALAYALEYFRGLREEVGSLRALRAETKRLRRPSRFAAMRAAIRADHDSMRRYRAKYHHEEVPASRLPLDLVRKIGFQMLALYRLMRFFDECRVPVLPMLTSRVIRHLYGADIHWKARIEPGVSIVHGVGLVLSHASRVGSGCILSQHVTLGENVDRASGLVGAPSLGRDVHVGPGATVLGPIHVGTGSKIGAGAVLMRSVAAASIVMPPEAVVRPRERALRAQCPPSAGPRGRRLDEKPAPVAVLQASA